MCLLPAEVFVPRAAAATTAAVSLRSGPNQQTAQTESEPQSQPEKPPVGRFVLKHHVLTALDSVRGA